MRQPVPGHGSGRGAPGVENGGQKQEHNLEHSRRKPDGLGGPGAQLEHNCCNAVQRQFCKSLKRMAGTTRLELATSAVTGQRSNQLNYVPAEG